MRRGITMSAIVAVGALSVGVDLARRGPFRCHVTYRFSECGPSYLSSPHKSSRRPSRPHPNR